MGYLPDIVDGKLVLTQEQKAELKVAKRYHNKLISIEKKKFLKDRLHQFNLSHNTDKNLSDLNNLGRSEVTEDFSDSLHLNK